MTKEEKKLICNRIMTDEPKMEQLILKYFTGGDFQRIEERKIGGGVIGGKACGLLVAHKLVSAHLPECEEYLAPHDSWFVGTELFRNYLLEGRLILAGTVKEQFQKMLESYGDSPIIVRSSSIMEDGYDHAFSGKYASVFCTSQGTAEEKLGNFLNAIEEVYESVRNVSAQEYRRKLHLTEKKEEMALLIQRVAGHRQGDLYFPAAAGMGCSYNPYKWMEYLNPDAGMLRIVMGLGTRAVERTPGDYPRLVGLDRPRANLRTTIGERHKYSQRNVDVIDLEEGRLVTKSLEAMKELLPEWQKRLLLSRDTEAEDILRQRRKYHKVFFADCQGLVETENFIHIMRRLLKMLEEEYARPVDIEFAVTGTDAGKWQLNLLQCRPLKSRESGKIHIPEDQDKRVLFDVRRTSVNRSRWERIDYIVHVDPRAYYECPYVKKPEIARIIGRINRELQDASCLLLVPGRIGTSSPELGVPVSYADVSCFKAICEVAYGEVGYHPDLSYGSHMFQDMIEADVYYGAINENSKTRLYQPELLRQKNGILRKRWEEEAQWNQIIEVYDVREDEAKLLLDAGHGRAVCIV